VWEKGGYRDIALYDVVTRTLTRVTHDRFLDLDPVFTRDGRYLLFSSDRSGIYNVYAHEVATGKLWQVTNVLGGAFRPAPSPDGTLLAYQGFGADGFDIHLTRLDPARFLEALPTMNTRPDPAEIPDTTAVIKADRPYSAWRSVWPRTYALNYAPDSFGQALTLTTAGSDAVGLHYWALALTYGFAQSTVNASGSYWYNGLWPSLGLGVFRSIGQRGGLFVDGRNVGFTETDVGGSASISLPVLQTADRSASVSASYRLEYLQNHNMYRVTHDPNQLIPGIPEEGRLASVSASADYYDAQGYLYSITAERGRYLHVGVSAMHPVLGSQYEVVTADWVWNEYIANPLIARHVLALRYAGGLGIGNLQRRGIYWLGGYQPQQDLLRTYIDPRAGRYGGPALRGYAPYSLYGDQYHLLNAEYRFPIAFIERGVLTLPFWVSRIYGAVFADYGNAFYGNLDLASFKAGVGGQISLDSIIGYYVQNTITMGFARGLMTGGVNQFYLFIGGSF
ncbi:MAG TPA: BamA/TamA family outer membrane protein, partial [Polyangia bacterium]